MYSRRSSLSGLLVNGGACWAWATGRRGRPGPGACRVGSRHCACFRPWDDSEFTTPGNQGERGRMDLLTVLMHEMGHILGLDQDDHGVMQEALDAGEREATKHGYESRP